MPRTRRSTQVRAGGRVLAAVVARPGLWPTAVRQARALTPRGWWHRPPFLPVPDRGWLRFRMETAYGDATRAPEPTDLVEWLRWCHDWRSALTSD